VATLLLGLALFAVAPAPARASDVSRGAGWLAAQQRPSGGFAASADGDAGAEMTSWAMLGLAAVGRNPLDVTKAGKSPVDFLRSHLGEIKDAGDVARTILALEAAGVDPRRFAGENLVDRLRSQRRDSGSYQGWPATSAYAVLALRAAGANDATAKTVAWLRKVQGKDGGWGNEPGDASTAEITGAVLQVLTPGGDAGERALGYLRDAKRPNGGFAPGNNLAANAQSTAWTCEGLLAIGKDPNTFGRGKSSFAYMRDLQADDGHFVKEPGLDATPVWVTANVLIPLSGHFLPVSAPPREPKPKTNSPTAGSQSSTGGISSSGSPSSANGKAGLEALENFGSGSGGGGGGTGGPSAGQAPPSGEGSSGAQAGKPSTGGRVPQGSLGGPPGGAQPEAAAPQGSATGQPASDSTGDSSSSTAGAIVLGLLAGCLLFALALAARRGWMRWRYGL
jgi:hypothetical protein